MNRRHFTNLSGLALPALLVPSFRDVQAFYTRTSMQNLPAPIAAHLHAFKEDLTCHLTNHQASAKLADTMLSPRKIVHFRFQNAEHYFFSFVNCRGNTITLQRINGRCKTILS